MEFYDYLIEEFGYDEPILVEDIAKKTGKEKATIRQRLRRLEQKNQLVRVQNGVYFAPSKNPMFGRAVLEIGKILTKKYLRNQNTVTGFEAGINFANKLGLTTQTASVPIIVTNQASRDQRMVQIYNNKVVIRKPRMPVTERNYKALQVFDLLNNFEEYSEKPLISAKDVILSYLDDAKLSKRELENTLDVYPVKTKARAYELGLFNEVAH